MVEVLDARIASVAHQRLDFGQHRLLDLRVLDHGLDDDVDFLEVAVVERRADARRAPRSSARA